MYMGTSFKTPMNTCLFSPAQDSEFICLYFEYTSCGPEPRLSSDFKQILEEWPIVLKITWKKKVSYKIVNVILLIKKDPSRANFLDVDKMWNIEDENGYKIGFGANPSTFVNSGNISTMYSTSQEKNSNSYQKFFKTKYLMLDINDLFYFFKINKNCIFYLLIENFLDHRIIIIYDKRKC